MDHSMDQSQARRRWQRVRIYASSIRLAMPGILAALTRSQALEPVYGPVNLGFHNRYLRLLRQGSKQAVRIVRTVDMRERLSGVLGNALDNPAAAVTEVHDDDELEALALWQQGDAALYSVDNLDARAKLRHDPRVLEGLHAFWDVALRSIQQHPVAAKILPYRGYEVMMLRCAHASPLHAYPKPAPHRLP